MKKRSIFLITILLILAILIGISCVTPNTIDASNYTPKAYAGIFSLFPPFIAIILALITKEVYASLFVGILAGGLLYANGNLIVMLETIFFHENGGMIGKLSNHWNVGILIFLVILGILVVLMNITGGSNAFGRWSQKHIKTRVGAQIATVILGILIFVDDYFNCLTVGSVMRPVTDSHKISRAKLAYLIDATAAPICIIAPVSSWAAAVTSSVPDGADINGFTMFLRTIPYNFYAILTLIMIIIITIWEFDFGPMKLHEENAKKGDLYTTNVRTYESEESENIAKRGKVVDLVFPIITLIICCIFGMLYTGDFFSGKNFIDAFADADASKGLVFGSSVTLIITFIFYISRETLTFERFMECIPKGFKTMVAPILILTLAWTLSGMTEILGAKYFVANLVENTADSLQVFLPAGIFVVSVFLAFATGTSWGTFAILIPIVFNAFTGGDLLVISIAACLSGAVCGDHCSPISDTTIMASAGAHSDHINHVSTQIPYVLTVAVVSFTGYIIAGILANYQPHLFFLSLPISILLLVITLYLARIKMSKKNK